MAATKAAKFNSMQRFRGFFFALWFCFWVFAAPVGAHDLNVTGVKVRIEKSEVTISVAAHAHDLKTDDPESEIARRLQLRVDGEPFSALKPHLIRDPANGIVIWQGQQPRTLQAQTNSGKTEEASVAIDAAIFPEIAGQSTVVTVFQNRETVGEALLDEKHPTAVIGQMAPSSSVGSRFFWLGIAHIFGGVDHVLFLLSLLLLGGSWQQLLKIVTAFTLAHGITLSLAATGVFSLSPRLVEPVIALSIVVVAVTNLRTPRQRQTTRMRDYRPYLAFGFGLIHGFGFAGALSEVGLPREALGLALLAFNGGVEVGQAALVLLFAPALAFLVKKWPRMQRPVVHFGSATIAAVGAFWFFQRITTV